MLKKIFQLVFRKVISFSVFCFRGQIQSVCLYICFFSFNLIMSVYPSPSFSTFNLVPTIFFSIFFFCLFYPSFSIFFNIFFSILLFRSFFYLFLNLLRYLFLDPSFFQSFFSILLFRSFFLIFFRSFFFNVLKNF